MPAATAINLFGLVGDIFGITGKEKSKKRAREFARRQFALDGRQIDNAQQQLLSQFAEREFQTGIQNIQQQAQIGVSTAERGVSSSQGGRIQAVARNEASRAKDFREEQRDFQLTGFNIQGDRAQLGLEQGLEANRKSSPLEMLFQVGSPRNINTVLSAFGVDPEK